MPETTSAVPNPGSDEARSQGCTCPVIENHYSKGIRYGDTTQFYVNSGCPLHMPFPRVSDHA